MLLCNDLRLIFVFPKLQLSAEHPLGMVSASHQLIALRVPPWRSTRERGGCGQDPDDFEPPGMGDPLLIFQAEGDTSFTS